MSAGLASGDGGGLATLEEGLRGLEVVRRSVEEALLKLGLGFEGEVKGVNEEDGGFEALGGVAET